MDTVDDLALERGWVRLWGHEPVEAYEWAVPGGLVGVYVMTRTTRSAPRQWMVQHPDGEVTYHAEPPVCAYPMAGPGTRDGGAAVTLELTRAEALALALVLQVYRGEEPLAVLIPVHRRVSAVPRKLAAALAKKKKEVPGG